MKSAYFSPYSEYELRPASTQLHFKLLLCLQLLQHDSPVHTHALLSAVGPCILYFYPHCFHVYSSSASRSPSMSLHLLTGRRRDNTPGQLKVFQDFSTEARWLRMLTWDSRSHVCIPRDNGTNPSSLIFHVFSISG